MTNLLKIIKLFQAFIELSEHNCNSSIKLESFLSIVLGIDLVLFKKVLVTNQEKSILQKVFQNGRGISRYEKGYLYKLPSFKNVKHFDIRFVDLYNLFGHKIISKEERNNLQEIIKCYKNDDYDCYLSILINDKYQTFLIEINTDLTKELVEIYKDIIHDEFIVQFIEFANIKENNILFEDYFVYLNKETIKQPIIETNIVLQILVDYDLSSNNYFAYVEIVHSNIQNDKKSDNWYPLMEVCFKDDEDEVYKFINKIGDILSKRVYYTYDDNIDYIKVAEIYYKISYTYQDLLNFIKYMIFLAYTTNL